MTLTLKTTGASGLTVASNVLNFLNEQLIQLEKESLLFHGHSHRSF